MTFDNSQLRTISLAALIERDGVILHGQSERYGPCPKCGGDDRFHLRSYAGREYFFCRQCHDKRGDAIEYLRWLHGMTFAQACDALGLRRERPALPASRPTPKTARGIVIPSCLDEPPAPEWQDAMRAFVADCAAYLPGPVRDYLHGRGLTDEAIARHRIGYNATSQHVAGEWWTWRGIVIPTTYGGHLWRVNVRRRAADLADGNGKYINARGSKAQLFNGDALATDPHTVVMCAGEFDAMLVQQHAPDGVAAITFGSETKRPTWEADYLLRDRRVLIAYDNDDAGDAGAAQWTAFGQRASVPSPYKDVTEFAQAGGDVGAWITTLLHDDFEVLLLTKLADMGYEPRYGHDGHIIAQRESVAA
jgi:hypothetical protein